MNTPNDNFQHFKEIIGEKLNNIDKSKVRGEFKLSIYERYALPSLRFHLSIHDLHKTHLEALDKMTKKFIKKWLNYPTRGVTDLGIFHPLMLKVKQPSQLYMEGHAGNIAMMRLKGDEVVNKCIDSKINREEKWKNKYSTATECNKMFAKLVEQHKIVQPTTGNISKTHISHAKKEIKKCIQAEVKDTWDTRVNKLVMQGNFTKLLIKENENVTWQSIARKMPRNVMAFATRICTNSLPSPDNLKRWGKRKVSTCPLCKNPCGTLAHIVNFCPTALKQQRFTWRHDSVLQHLTKEIKKLAKNNLEVFSDIPGHTLNGATIPADIFVAIGKGSRPDLVIVNRKEKKIALMELTCPLEQNVDKANAYKTTTYTPLQLSLEEKGFQVELLPFEIGSSGHITNHNKKGIENILRKFGIKLKPHIFTNLSKISLLCTMSIFYAYQTSDWVDPPLLEP